MEIYIDGKPLDADQNTNAPINLALSSITDVATGKIPFSKTIKIPDTPENRRKMGYASEVYALERFNNARHPARIEQDGFVVMQGVAQLSKVETTATGRYFHLNLIGTEIEWITATSETPLSETQVALSGVISDALVRLSLNSAFSAPYRLFPIQKGRFAEEAGEDKWQERMQTTLSDYAPFFQLPILLRAIFGQAGYSVSSRFLESSTITGLYVSGRWRRFDTDLLDEKFGFRAGRFAGKEVKIGENGVEAAAVGNIVDTADPDAEDEDGEKAGDVYNNGGGFQKIDGKPYYVVSEDMTLGLIYKLHYFSPVKPEYGERGFKNCAWLKQIEISDWDGQVRNFDLSRYAPNFNTDVRKAIAGGIKYYFVAPLPSAGSGELLLGFQTDEDTPEDILESEMIKVQHKMTFTTEDTIYGRAYLFCKKDGGVPELVGDYYWHIFEVPTEVEIEANIHLPAKRHTAGTQIPIATPAFRGYTTYRRLEVLSLSNDTTVETCFAPQVEAGDAISAANMLAFDDVKQLDFIKGVKQLFNLHLYTDSTNKTVYIEPRDDFYSGPVLDWTDKVDYSKTIELEELGGDIGRNFVLSYKEGDPQAEARNKDNKTKYAQFSAPILNTVGKQEDYRVANEFFTPAIVKAGGYSAAKDAPLVQIGDPADADDEAPYLRDMSFEPKIVKYNGMVRLPSGQQWHYPDIAGTQVPVIAFQDNSVNLGFDGENGLNRYYRENVEMYNHGRRLTLYLHLTPRDVEPFIILNNIEKQDFRATIKLRMNGENVLCRLEEIKDFDPKGRNPTKCVLITG